jgi:putative ABC transport system permease protein
MEWLGIFGARLLGLFRKRQLDSDLEAELRAHLDLLTEENIRRGLSPVEARHAARREFGGVEQAKEDYRDQRGLPFLETLLQDVRYALRTLSKSPSFTAVAVLTLALGIGANTAIFSVSNAVLLRPLPYQDPEKLVRADEFWPRMNDTVVPNPDYTNWKLHNQSFEELAAYNGGAQVNLTGAGMPERLESVSVTANLLPMLGVHSALGRPFLLEEAQPGDHFVALLSDVLWKEKFGGDPNIPGKSVTLDKQSYTIIGVLPPNFRFPDRRANPQIILPFKLPPAVDWTTKSLALTRVIGRLKPGVSLRQAHVELVALCQQADANIPAVYLQMREGLQVHVTGLHEKLVGDVRPSLLMLVAAVAFALLIGCINIANLQLARTASRQKELAVRAAIGAGRVRLLRQLLTEGALIATAGGAAGSLVAAAGVRLLRIYAPTSFLQIGSITMDRRVLSFTFGVTYLTALLFSAVPALRGSKPNVNAFLKEAHSFTEGEYGQRMLRSALVISELAMAVVVLVASGLLIRSFVRLSNVDTGFDPSNLLTVSTALPESKYAAPAQRREFFQQVLQRISALPGVRSAALTSSLPLTDYAQIDAFLVEGEPDKPAGAGPLTPVEHVSPGYFKTMRIPQLEGRVFDDADSTPGIHAVILNEVFVQRFLSNGDPIGKRIRFGPPESPWTTIVGVVGNVRHVGLDRGPEPEVYVPYAADPALTAMLVVRTESDPRSLAAAVREQVIAVDAEQPVFGVSPMEQRLADSMSGARFNTTLLSFFGLVALVLASVGVYGVIAYFVSQRTHEIGIRMALGASGRNVLRMVMGQGIAMTAIGLLLGLGGALAVTRFLSSLLFEIRPSDPATIVGVMAMLGGVALAACYLPARRAMRVDPMVALRYE